VIGVPDEILGQAIKAFVAFKDGQILNERDIIRHCKRNLEDFMVPKEILFMRNLPKSPNGKIDKISLKRVSEQEIAE